MSTAPNGSQVPERLFFTLLHAISRLADMQNAKMRDLDECDVSFREIVRRLLVVLKAWRDIDAEYDFDIFEPSRADVYIPSLGFLPADHFAHLMTVVQGFDTLSETSNVPLFQRLTHIGRHLEVMCLAFGRLHLAPTVKGGVS